VDFTDHMKARSNTAAARYPVPGKTGGALIRETIGFLKSQGLALPLRGSVVVAFSAGCDSMALGHLLATYGRRIVDKGRLSFLHINHGWRGAESDGDEQFARECTRKFNVKITVVRLKPPHKGQGGSLEDLARAERKKIFEKATRRSNKMIFTAHHADDLAETVLWRILTGSSSTHGGGISAVHDNEVRPFLRVRKTLLKKYLKEEKQPWREDRTNHEGSLLRTRMRRELMGRIEKLFPKAVDHLVRLALDAQNAQKLESKLQARQLEPAIMLTAAGVGMRRSHWEMLDKIRNRAKGWRGGIDLPGGWRLERTGPATDRKIADKWILQKRM